MQANNLWIVIKHDGLLVLITSQYLGMAQLFTEHSRAKLTFLTPVSLDALISVSVSVPVLFPHKGYTKGRTWKC